MDTGLKKGYFQVQRSGDSLCKKGDYVLRGQNVWDIAKYR